MKQNESLSKQENDNSCICVPDSELKKLQEFCNGGFFLIAFDSFGVPRYYKSADSLAYDMALIKAAELFVKRESILEEEDIMSQIYEEDERDAEE